MPQSETGIPRPVKHRTDRRRIPQQLAPVFDGQRHYLHLGTGRYKILRVKSTTRVFEVVKWLGAAIRGCDLTGVDLITGGLDMRAFPHCFGRINENSRHSR